MAIPFRDVMTSPLSLYHGDEHCSLCRFDSWDVLYTFEVFEYSLDVLLFFHFLSLIHFLMRLLTSFRRCFSSFIFVKLVHLFVVFFE